jgi:hypothetical protein
MATKTQTDRILAYLKRGKPLTPIQALSRFGVFRLAARIAELRAAGHKILSRMVSRGGKRYAVYWMG